MRALWILACGAGAVSAGRSDGVNLAEVEYTSFARGNESRLNHVAPKWQGG
jgi:hypothetical protein